MGVVPRESSEVRARLIEELLNHPYMKFPDGNKRLAKKVGYSASFICNLQNYAPLTKQAAVVLIEKLQLDEAYIRHGVRTPPTPPEPPSFEIGNGIALPQTVESGEPSVRDWFAMSAMNAFLPSTPTDLSKETVRYFALASYRCADAMLEAREA